MKPIEYIFYDKSKYIKKENDLLQGQYDLKEQFNYTPELVESLLKNMFVRYDVNNGADKIAEHNETLQAYNNAKQYFIYLASVKCDKTQNIIEYYKREEDIIAYLILKPKDVKYYPSLQAVAVFKKKNNINVN